MSNGVKYMAQLCIVLILETSDQLYAQTTREPESKIINDLMERWIENTESTVDYTDLQEQLESVMKNKIDLNKADRFKLQQLFVLNEMDINAILQHRKVYGDFMSIYELQTIESIDERTLYYLTYFVKVGDDLDQDHTPVFKRIQKGKHELFVLHENDFQDRAGYSSKLKEQGKSYYLGSPERYVLRYRFNYSNKLSFGYSGEKDMGEQFITNDKGFDFNSVHLIIRDIGRWKAVAVGDYQVNFGQGLTFGTGLSARKSAYVLNVRKSFQSIRPYRSLNENEFLRGAAATYSLKHFALTVFGSNKKISTNYQLINDTSETANGSFSSIQLTGLHRTETELNNKDNVKQTIFGGHLRYQTQWIELGFTAVKAQYDRAFLSGTKPYQLYSFSGTELMDMGVDYGFQIRNTNIFGECSHSGNGGLAGILGLNTALHQNLDLVMVYRNYGKNYQVIFNNPFAENSDGKNEEGLYTGISFKLAKRWQLNVYYDWYRSPWLRYLTDAPSRGLDYLAEVQYNPNKRAQFYIRYRNETKNKNQSDNTTPTDYTSISQRQQYRFNAQYTITEKWVTKSRLEMIRYQNEESGQQNGILLFQDLSYVTSNKKLSFTMRMAIFSVDDYNARVYATEQDVLYQYAVPLYQNSGIRYYGVCHIRLSKKIDCWFKYSQTQYSNVQSISTGLERIDGNKLSDLRIQVRLTL
jgi:predicted nucleotidyltransferase